MSMNIFSLFGTTFVIFAVFDLLFITYVVTPLYRSKLGDVLLDRFALAPAFIFYCIYIAGVVYFAVLPSLKSGSIVSGLVNGALLGGFAYATFTLTNMAVLKNWPLVIAISDILWGMFLTGIVAAVVVWFFK